MNLFHLCHAMNLGCAQSRVLFLMFVMDCCFLFSWVLAMSYAFVSRIIYDTLLHPRKLLCYTFLSFLSKVMRDWHWGQFVLNFDMHTFRGSHIYTSVRAFMFINWISHDFVLSSITKKGEIVSAINHLRVLEIEWQRIWKD